MDRSSCHSCGSAKCIKLRRLPASASPIERSSLEAPAGNKPVCVNCLLQASCSSCSHSEQCQLTRQNCTDCSSSVCVARK
jgi:hypothetical protein